MVDVEAYTKGYFKIALEKPVTEELKGFPKVWAIRRVDNDHLEFETPQFFNALRYVHEAVVQESHWETAIDNAIDRLALGKDTEVLEDEEDGVWIIDDGLGLDDDLPNG